MTASVIKEDADSARVISLAQVTIENNKNTSR
jgi:hypothetical protein